LLQTGGLSPLFDEERLDELSLLFKLYSPVENGLKPIADSFKAFVIQQGKQKVESTETQQNGKDLSSKDVLANSQIMENLLKL